MSKKIITFGEVLLRLSGQHHERLQQASVFDVVYGGSEANVSVALSQWFNTTSHVSVLPDNDLGYAAIHALRKFGVGVESIQLQPGRIGIYLLENGASVRASKVIYDRYDSAFAKLNANAINWEEILKGADWFHWSGITPAISASAAKACLEAVKAARKLNIKISGDINYRRVLWQYGKSPQEIMPELISYCDVVIGGKTDFENCLGIVPQDEEDPFVSVCKQVTKQFPAANMFANTVRDTIDASENSLYGIFYAGNKLYTSQVYNLHDIVDRIGSGDAFMAGLIHKLLHSNSLQETIEFATAAAAFKHTIPGDALIATQEEINQLVQGINVGKLLR